VTGTRGANDGGALMFYNSRVMRGLLKLVVPIVAFVAWGCAAHRAAPARVARVSPVPATQAVAPATVPSITTLALDDILPEAVLPKPRAVARATTAPSTAPATAASTQPATQPAPDRPPIEALLLYGQAVDNLNAGRRMAAVDLLQKAAALDPDSFELHFALGRAYTRDGMTPDPRSIPELERAAEINPDHLRLQAELGRMYLATGEPEKALWHLRLAAKTSAYWTDHANAAIAELLLTRALSRQGYHAAAVEVYERLAARMENPTGALRANPELAFLIARPELLRLQAAESYERIGRFDKALSAYQSASQKDPGSFELRARVVRALAALKRYDEAAAEAADAVARFRASPASVALLREVAAADGKAGGLVEELERLRRQRPRERSLLFASADVMRTEGRIDEARQTLRGAADSSPADPEVVRRLYELERDAEPDTAAGAARFLIDWSARHPDAVHLLGDHWDDLLRQSGPRRTGLRELRALQMPAGADARWKAAREFWVAHVARLRHRRDVARAALRRAAEARPLFAPALRAWAGWDREELGITAAERDSTVGQMAAAAEADGNGPAGAALAEELRGMQQLSARNFPAARERLARAAALDGKSPERQFALAVAARGAGDEAAFEQVLWKLVSDWPGFEDAYEALYSLYDARDADGAAARVLAAWVTADPASVPARIAQVREQLRAGRVVAAQGLVQRLFADKPGDPRVLTAVRAIYGQGERTLAWLVSELQTRHAAAPGDMATAAQLVDLLADQGRAAEATRALDATRTAVAQDPDLLYQVAHLYERLGQKATTERVLGDVLELEPGHAPAANDLGYSLAEDGKDLVRAEELARLAVGAEPANASFLDSLGWVLYKRGRLDEARTHLEKSAASDGGDDAQADGEGPDPVVLDHLGDTIYRQGDAAAAGEAWGRAVQRLADMPPARRDRDDLKQLRLQLDRKRKQLDAGQPVSTAPVVETARGGAAPPSVK